jgi:hypothetical protein
MTRRAPGWRSSPRRSATGHEAGKLKPEALAWQGDLALVKKTNRGGVTRFDLAQRADGQIRVYYGVTEDGVHGAWKRLVGEEEIGA